MTLKKKELKDYEERDPLRAAHLGDDGRVTIISPPPRIIKTKFTDEQPVVDVKAGINSYTWWANWTSFNALIEQLGEDEEKHVGKEIQIESVRQPVDGKMKKVLYLKGSFVDDED